ncbi:MAG: hypothetical protein FJY74_00700 [Candidatus Eisenbacteria bacterium]|nr:hypothetical protein [Candidatus Eisenbacteria bacterium]
MNDARSVAADRLLWLAVAQHLVLYTTAAVYWARRRAMNRFIDWCLASAFATAAVALLATPGARPAGAFAAALAALWVRDALAPANAFAFETAPRHLLVAMGAAAAFGAAYPGYAAGLPAVLFSPYGVLLEPTLLVALAVLNCAERADRALRWALAATGLLWGALGAVADGPLKHAPLLVASGCAVALALGAGGRRAPRADDRRSVRSIRDRMYTRWTLLPGPRDLRRGRPR